jgi:hypothetical protein
MAHSLTGEWKIPLRFSSYAGQEGKAAMNLTSVIAELLIKGPYIVKYKWRVVEEFGP